MLTSGVISKPCLPCTVCVDKPITITLAPSSRKRITGTQNSRSSTSCATKIPTVFPCRRIIYIAPFQVQVHETLYHVLKRKSPIPYKRGARAICAKHDNRPSHDDHPAHDDRKGHHYYTHMLRPVKALYSSDDPCGHHASVHTLHITAPWEAVLVGTQPVAAPRSVTELVEADMARSLLDTSPALAAGIPVHRVDIPAGMVGIVVDTADWMAGNMVYIAAVAAGNRFVRWVAY